MSGPATVRIRKGTSDGTFFEKDLIAVEEHLEETDRENEFISSVRKQWDENDSVTEKQWDGVTAFLDRIE